CLSCSVPVRDLPSFPTRRSSDLGMEQLYQKVATPSSAPPTATPSAGTNADFSQPVALSVPAAADATLRGGSASVPVGMPLDQALDRKSTRLNSSHGSISYAVFCL